MAVLASERFGLAGHAWPRNDQMIEMIEGFLASDPTVWQYTGLRFGVNFAEGGHQCVEAKHRLPGASACR
jgi:hypothetical protein